MKSISLIGFMGTGKSTISELLAEQLECSLVDLDAYIEKKAKTSISSMFEEYGEAYFRQKETEAVYDMADCKDMMVLSCGGGTVLKDENVSVLKSFSKVVLLTATPETVYHRVKNSTNRPILNGNMNVEYIASLMERRKERYLTVCDVFVETDKKTPEDIVEEIVKICTFS